MQFIFPGRKNQNTHMLRFVLCCLLLHKHARPCSPSEIPAPMLPQANYALAARFSQKKQDKLVFSTLADVHWLKQIGALLVCI